MDDDVRHHANEHERTIPDTSLEVARDEQPARKLPWYEDPERRQAHLDKLAEGRARKAQEVAEERRRQLPPPVAPERAEGEPDYPALMRAIRMIRWDRMELSVADGLLGIIDQARMEGMSRLQSRRERESSDRCSYCNDPFPGGRHYEQVSWMDLDTQRIISKLACRKLTCRSQMREDHDRERRRRIG